MNRTSPSSRLVSNAARSPDLAMTGPDVARILRAIEDRWVAEGFPDAERVYQLLDEQLAG